MPSSPTLLAFAAAASALVALPGPNLFYLVARSISEGRRAGWASGCLYLAVGAFAALSPAHRTR